MSTDHHTNDTREHGQRSIFQSLGASAKSSKMKEAEAQRQPEVSSKETSDHAPSEEVEEIQAVIPDNPNLVSPRKRMREENGGISEQHSTSTGAFHASRAVKFFQSERGLICPASEIVPSHIRRTC